MSLFTGPSLRSGVGVDLPQGMVITSVKTLSREEEKKIAEALEKLTIAHQNQQNALDEQKSVKIEVAAAQGRVDVALGEADAARTKAARAQAAKDKLATLRAKITPNKAP